MFAAATLVTHLVSPDNFPEKMHPVQKFFGVCDLISAALITLLAVGVILNNAHVLELSFLNSINNQTAYFLFLAPGVAALVNLTAFCIHLTVKVNHLKKIIQPDRLATQNLEARIENESKKTLPPQTTDKKEIKNLKKQLSTFEHTQLQEQQKHQDEIYRLNATIDDLSQQIVQLETEKKQLAQTIANQKENVLDDDSAIDPKEGKLMPNKIRLVVDDTKENTPCVEGNSLFISASQKQAMEKDPYFRKFLTTNLDNSISSIQEFLSNLKVYLNPKMHKLFLERESIGIIRLQEWIKNLQIEFEDFFAELGLSKDKAFIQHNSSAIGTAVTCVLDNLKHADEMDNEILVLFWCQALSHYMPIKECIDSFTMMAQIPLKHPEHLHELLLKHLLLNVNEIEAQEFFQKNKGVLKIKTLDLELLVSVIIWHKENGYSINNTENYKKIDYYLNAIDLNCVQIIQRGEDNGYENIPINILEVQYIASLCKANCTRHGRLVRGRFVDDLQEIEDQMPIIDLSRYYYTCDRIVPQRKNHIELRIEGSAPLGQRVHVLYLKEHEKLVTDYLKTYYGFPSETARLFMNPKT